jgi:hypothetical protein
MRVRTIYFTTLQWSSPSTSPRYNGAVRLFSFLPTQEPIEDLWSTPQRPSTMPPPEQIMVESEHRDEMHRGLCCVSGLARCDYCLFPGPWRWAVPFTPFSFLFLFFFCFFIYIYIYVEVCCSAFGCEPRLLSESMLTTRQVFPATASSLLEMRVVLRSTPSPAWIPQLRQHQHGRDGMAWRIILAAVGP